ncbi:MAG: hypothetical protein AAGA54_33695 [Myxococcota bacterium]
MTIRTAARPLVSLALFGALSLSYGCDSGSDDGDTDGGSSTSGAEGSTTATTETPTTGTPTTGTPTTGTTDDSDGSSSTGEGDGSTSGSTGEGDGSTSTGSTGEALIGYSDIVGVYTDGFGTHTLTEATWELDYDRTPLGTQGVEQVNDDERWVAGFFDGDDSVWLPGYSRFDWDFDENGVLRYCQQGSGSKTIEDAIAAPASDREDFEGEGCGGFSWSSLEPL